MDGMDALSGRLLSYWFGSEPHTEAAVSECLRRWFAGSPKIDAEIAARFGAAARCAADGSLDRLGATPEGRLALILLLDQVPRHLYRGTAAAFPQDDKALELTLTGIDADMDSKLPALRRAFFYMPLSHAESRDMQELSVRKFSALESDERAAPQLRAGLQQFAEFARVHRDIVLRFGRFPHRNRLLGRENTADEEAYVGAGGSSFGQ